MLAVVGLKSAPRHYGVRIYKAGSGDAWVTENGKALFFNNADEALSKAHEFNQRTLDGSWFVAKERTD